MGFSLDRFLLPCCLLVIVAMPLATLRADDTLAILPGDFQLTGGAARQRLLVERIVDGDYAGQVTDGVELTSSDPGVVRIEDGVAWPVADGRATIAATLGPESAVAEVRVVGTAAAHEWSFRNHVLAVMAKVGCNSGACHGALAGKGGFKLSLRGYDPLTDYQTVTRQARGRRVELADPGRSLILAKPSGAIPHKGGVRFDVDSLEYEVLSKWIAGGAKPPRADDPQVLKLEVLPPQSILRPGANQQLVVRAHFSDGHTEDVTRWAKYSSTNESVAMVEGQGRVSIVGHGGGAITAWYASHIVVAQITSPYPNEVSPEVFAGAARHNLIDELVLEKLEQLRLPPSPPASDREFLRRAFLDTIGTLPTAEEVRAFLGDESPDKRDRLIDDLLARVEFVDYWTYKWSDLLLLNGNRLKSQPLRAYYEWIRQSVAENKPWDRLVREIVTSSGSSYDRGPTNFYALHQDPESMSENTCQAFLGLSIGCAKCHNHPLEKWTNGQYYAMANLFARVRAKDWGSDFQTGDGLRTVYVTTKGDLVQPLTGKPQPPTPLDGDALRFDSPQDRRVHLARWLTAPENPYFARAITNRVWANFFGVGLVERVDDLRASNPASNEALLSAAADYLVRQGYDLKALMRTILQSATYQRSSRPLPENKEDGRFYSRYYPRRLMAEVLLDAISQVTEVPTEFKQRYIPGGGLVGINEYPLGTRALELRDASVFSYFLKTFGRPERVITCDCERTDEPTMVQVLHISNGDTISQKLQAKDNRISRQLAEGVPYLEIIEGIYLSALSRYPTNEEKIQILAEMAEAGGTEKRILVEDIYWSVLSSREFLFNH